MPRRWRSGKTGLGGKGPTAYAVGFFLCCASGAPGGLELKRCPVSVAGGLGDEGCGVTRRGKMWTGI